MKHAINIVTGTSLDVGTDYIMSLIYGQEFNLGESLIKNSVSNTLSEIIGEPV